MKVKQLFVALLSLILVAGMASAQNPKLEKQANKQIESLNQKIASVDASLALSDEQRESLLPVFVEKIKAVRKVKKSEMGEDEKTEQIRAARKAANQKVNEVLTKAQLKARREGSKKN